MTTKRILNPTMWITLSLILVASLTVQAQSLKIVPTKSNAVVSGTSTLHPWDMKVAQVSGEGTANAAKQLATLVIRIPVKSLKSAEGSIMDGKAYDAFDAKKNPNIVFTLTEATPVKITNQDVEATLTGTLAMAGSSKKISFKAAGKVVAGGFQLKGAVPLKMTEYGMKPPTAIFGTIKTGDAITVKFDVTVEGAL